MLLDPNVALKRQLGVLPNLYPVRIPTIYGGNIKKCSFLIEGRVIKALSFLTVFTKRFFTMVYG